MKKKWNGNYEAKFEDLKGKTLLSAVGLSVGSESVNFTTDTSEKYKMSYYEDCCAQCTIEDICGDTHDILGSPILLAEESSSREPSDEVALSRLKEKTEKEVAGRYYYGGPDSETWTFYRLSTIKGSITIRWYGFSNGYYSESVTFERMGDES
jgi:hypothetical protein